MSNLKKTFQFFFKCLKIDHIILFIYSKCPAIKIDEKELLNSSKSFSVKSLRFPRGALGVGRSLSSSSIIAELEDVCSLEW